METRYQPICDVWRNNCIIGYEATTEGFLDIIHSADKADVTRIDYQARSKALNELLPQLSAGQRIFVNLFPDDGVGDAPWFDEAHDLSKVTVEITEHQLLPTNERVLRELESNRKRGMQIALDDFGVGNDTLKLVDIIHPDCIKLDKFFVRKMRSSGRSTSIRGMLKFCEEANINLIVEGVESKHDYDALVDLGVRYLQGWYLGCPEPLDRLFRRH